MQFVFLAAWLLGIMAAPLGQMAACQLGRPARQIKQLAMWVLLALVHLYA